MANKYKIAAEFTLVDKASKTLSQMGTSGALLGNALSKSYKAAEERVAAFGQAAVKAGKMAAGIATGAVVAGLGVAAKEYIEFNNALTQSTALFKDTQNLSGEEMLSAIDSIGQKAREVAAVTEFTATDMAGALQKMAMAGIDSSTSMQMLRGTTDLATAAGMDLVEAVDIATDALDMFKNEGSIAAMAGNVEGQLTRINDVMAYTQASFNTNVSQMWEAMKNAGAGFVRNGQSIDVLAASIGALSSVAKGGEAGTQLNALMTTLSQGAKQAKLAAKGIDITDSSGNYLNLFDIISQIEEKTKNMGEAQKSAWLSDVFDTRALKAVSQLLNVGSEQLKQYEANVNASAGAAANMAATMRTSLANQIEVLKSSLMELGFKFVSAFQNQGSDAIGKLTEFIQNFDPAPFIAGMDRVLSIIGGILSTAWNLRGVIIGVAVAIGTYRLAMDAAVIATNAYKVITTIITAAQAAYAIVVNGSTAAQSALTFATNGTKIATALFSAVLKGVQFAGMIGGLVATKVAMIAQSVAAGVATGATTAFSTAMGFLNAVFVASPIGWIVLAIVAAIAALVAIIVLCVKHWDEIVAALQRAWEWLKNVGEMIGGFFMSVWESFTNWISETLLPIWNSVVDAFKGFGEWISGVFVSAWNGLGSIVTGIIDGIKSAWETLTSAFTSGGILGGLKTIGGFILNFLLSPIQTILDLISRIPGVGNLTSGLSESLQSFRDGLIGVDTSDSELSTTTPTNSAWTQSTQSNYYNEYYTRQANVNIGLEKPLEVKSVTGSAPEITIDRTRTGSF